MENWAEGRANIRRVQGTITSRIGSRSPVGAPAAINDHEIYSVRGIGVEFIRLQSVQ